MSLIFKKSDVKSLVFNILSSEKDKDVKDEIANRVIMSLTNADYENGDYTTILSSAEDIVKETIFEYNNLYNM